MGLEAESRENKNLMIVRAVSSEAFGHRKPKPIIKPLVLVKPDLTTKFEHSRTLTNVMVKSVVLFKNHQFKQPDGSNRIERIVVHHKKQKQE